MISVENRDELEGLLRRDSEVFGGTREMVSETFDALLQ